MATLLGAGLIVLLLSVWIARGNARFERSRRAASRELAVTDGDGLVEAAWDGSAPLDDVAAMRQSVDALLDAISLGGLQRKSSLVTLGILAARAGRHDVLAPIADRAGALDGGCGETAALGVLAAAYAGDRDRVRTLLARSQAAMAGCARCGAGADTKILMHEVDLAVAALEEGALASDEASTARA